MLGTFWGSYQNEEDQIKLTDWQSSISNVQL
jgi:hypothetical protein